MATQAPGTGAVRGLEPDGGKPDGQLVDGRGRSVSTHDSLQRVARHAGATAG